MDLIMQPREKTTNPDTILEARAFSLRWFSFERCRPIKCETGANYVKLSNINFHKKCSREKRTLSFALVLQLKC